MNPWILSAIAVVPWALFPLIVLLRMRGATMLSAYAATPPERAVLVSVIVPARNEAHNIEACVRSILGSSWPSIEVIVVNDSSSDETGAIAAAIARMDTRLHVLDAPPLPDGWMGKQWACHTGAAAARGDFLLFTDADTRYTPELVTRAVNALRARAADLLSVGGAQLMETFWERLLQPHIFWILAARYGSPDTMSRSTNPINKIANGQFMLVTRSAYAAEGGHAAVRQHVAEDLRIAQEWTRHGRSVQLVMTTDEFATRMYRGLGEVARGWGKNIYAAGRDTVPLGRVGQRLLRAIFPLPALWEVVPALVAIGWAAGWVGTAFGAWGAAAWLCNTIARAVVHHLMRAPLWMAPLNPLAALVFGGISAGAAWRGSRVTWKDRSYVSG